MPGQKRVPQPSVYPQALEVEGSAGRDAGTNPRNASPETDFMGDYLDTSNPIIWPRPNVGKEHGG